MKLRRTLLLESVVLLCDRLGELSGLGIRRGRLGVERRYCILDGRSGIELALE